MEQTEKSQNWGFWDPAVITQLFLFMPTYPQSFIILKLTRTNTKDLVFIQHIIQALKLFTWWTKLLTLVSKFIELVPRYLRKILLCLCTLDSQTADHAIISKLFFPQNVTVSKGPFIYYIITFLGFLEVPPPLRQHVFSTKNKQKLAFSDPPPPYKCWRNIWMVP